MQEHCLNARRTQINYRFRTNCLQMQNDVVIKLKQKSVTESRKLLSTRRSAIDVQIMTGLRVTTATLKRNMMFDFYREPTSATTDAHHKRRFGEPMLANDRRRRRRVSRGGRAGILHRVALANHAETLQCDPIMPSIV